MSNGRIQREMVFVHSLQQRHRCTRKKQGTISFADLVIERSEIRRTTNGTLSKNSSLVNVCWRVWESYRVYFRSTWMLGCVMLRKWNLSIAVEYTKSLQNSEERLNDCEWKCPSFILRWGHSCMLHTNLKQVVTSILSPLCHCNRKIADWRFCSAMENKKYQGTERHARYNEG